MRMTYTLLVALALVGLALPGVAAAQAEVTASYPVAMKFDGIKVPTRVYVRFPSTPIGEAYEAWRRKTLDPPAAAFVQLVQAARAGDLQQGRAALDLRSTGRSPTADVLRAIGGMAGGWARATIVARYVVDGVHVFVFQSQREGKLATGGIAVEQLTGGWKARVLTSQEPVRSLIVGAFADQANGPSEFAALPQTRTAYAVPLSADDRVSLEFDGQIVDYDPTDDKVAPGSPAMALYQQGVLALQRGDWQTFAALHTPKSKDKIEAWLANQGRDPAARETAAKLWALDTRVVFEMDIGPLGSVLVYAQGDQVEPDQQALKRVMIARAREGLLLSNYYMTYQFGLTLMRSPRWPKRAGDFRALLERSKR